MKPSRRWEKRVLVAGVCALAGLSSVSCVRRELQIVTNPPGALVYLNDTEVGRTPVTRPFTFYGTYDVVIRMEGYQTLKKKKLVLAPWWQWVPFDLVAEAFPLTDRQKIEFTLVPTSQAAVEPEEMLRRAAAMKARLPVTQPASKPAAIQPG